MYPNHKTTEKKKFTFIKTKSLRTNRPKECV